MEKKTETWYAITIDGYAHHIAYREKSQAEAKVQSFLEEDDSIMVIAIDEITVIRTPVSRFKE